VCQDESGTFPNGIGRLRKLKSFVFQTSTITSEIPDEFSRLENLVLVSFNSIFETGVATNIPMRIGKLTELTSLALTHNAFIGNLPVEVGNLQKLTSLKITENNFFGTTLPAEFSRLTSLKVLDLSQNNLTGQLPSWLFSSTSLNQFDLRDNAFEGSLPNIEEGVSVPSIILSGNKLNGSIPESLGLFRDMQNLILNDNLFSSSIPPILGNLTKLLTLQLDNNRLTGSLPVQLGRLVPPFGALKKFKMVGDTRPNTFYGSFPSSLLTVINDLPPTGTFDGENLNPTLSPTTTLSPTIPTFPLPPKSEFKQGDEGDLSVGLKACFVLAASGLVVSLFLIYYYRHRSKRKTAAQKHDSPAVLQMQMHQPRRLTTTYNPTANSPLFLHAGSQIGADDTPTRPGTFSRSVHSSPPGKIEEATDTFEDTDQLDLS